MLEAMAAGCPVICTNAASLPEVVGDSALLFPPKNREAATEQLDKLADSEFRKALIAKGRTRAREFSWRRTGDETVRVYKELS